MDLGKKSTARPGSETSSAMGEKSRGCFILCSYVVYGLILTLFLSFLEFVLSQEMVTGRINISNLGTGNVKDSPDSLSLDVKLGDNDIHLQLDKDPNFLPEYGVYQDLKNGAAFGVEAETDVNGATHYKLEGVVHTEGKLYDIKTVRTPLLLSTNGHQQRRRRSPYVGGYDDGREQEENFEVHVIPTAAIVSADSIARPPWIQVKREMHSDQQVQVAGTIRLPLPPKLLSHRKLRRKKAVTQDIVLDVVAIVDFGVYKTWYDRSNGSSASEKQQNTLQNIRKYYAFIFNGVSLLYKTITSLPYQINVRLSSIVIAATATASDWTEKYRMSAPQWDEVNANLALKAVSDWAATTDILLSYDHLMLFSGYDLTKTVSGVSSDKITGLAYTGTVCDTNGKATSIVEDLGGLQCIGTAAHELGHGLSAEHDGTENVCHSEDRYIMAAGTNDVTSTNKYNPWRFSSCTINYFNTFINSKINTAPGRQCLYKTLTVNSNIPNVTSQVEGQLYEPDTQCRQVYGPNSRLCRGPEFGSAADVCTEMFCFDPTSSATCYQLVAVRGTTCGNHKWCDSGQCIYNSTAPSTDEICVFGDQPGTAFDAMTCSAFVANFPGYCYQAVVKQRCCSSCAKFYNSIENCEYGDKATGCSSSSCPFASASYKQSCCGTCKYGTTTTPKTTSNNRTTTSTMTITTPMTIATAITSSVKNNPLCVDNKTVTINKTDCQTVVQTSPYLCYDSRVITVCCQSCRYINTGVIGCEFGDRRPDDCAMVHTNQGTCSTLQPMCCKTCQGYRLPTSGQASTVFSVILLLVSSCIYTLT